jgi:hypothetical protein
MDQSIVTGVQAQDYNRDQVKVLILALAFAACAMPQGLRLLRGQVSDLTAESLTIRDTLLRPNICALPAAVERLGTNGTADAPPLANGTYVEAIVEQDQRDGRCVVRTLYIRPPRSPAIAANRTTAFLDNMFPRGNLIYTGTVQAISEDKLELRSRRGLTTEFAVRQDTVFSTGGRVVAREQLPPQTVVQIRAGRTFAGDLEVYQIMWGAILPNN